MMEKKLENTILNPKPLLFILSLGFRFYFAFPHARIAHCKGVRGFILGLYRANGKENGNYYIMGFILGL